MSYRNEREVNYSWIAVIVFIAAIVIDFVMLQVISPTIIINRWLWLPLISGGLAGVAGILMSVDCENDTAKTVAGWVSSFWGIVRGIIVVVIYFSSVSGFWGIVSAIYHALFVLMFNGIPFFILGSILGEVHPNMLHPYPCHLT